MPLKETNGQCNNAQVNIIRSDASALVPTISRIARDKRFGKDSCQAFISAHKGIMSSGQTLNNHWYEVTINLKNNSDKEYILELNNSQTDHIDIYTRGSGGLEIALKSGDLVPYNQRNNQHRNIHFPLFDSDNHTSLWINVVNRGSYSIPLKIYDKGYFSAYDANRNLLIGMYLGLVSIFIIFVLASLVLANYDPTHLFYLLYLVFSALFFFSELGLSDIYLWPSKPTLEEPFLFLFILGSSAAFLLLVYNIFKIKEAENWLISIFKILLGGIFIGLTAVVSGLIKKDIVFVPAYYLILSVAGISFLYAVIAGASAIYRKVAYAKYFLMAFAVMIIGTTMKPLGLAGILPYSSFIHYGGIIGQSIEVISLSALLILEFFNRMKYVNTLETEVVQWEKSALQAQMNPHFIFNCLNSIQNYIAGNDKIKAMDYLSKFAGLVRKTLNASASRKITLQEEIEMLEAYLELEQLRFKNKFLYNIHIEDDLDTEDIEIPPLMIQPFVENAIIHGFKGIDYPGLLDIYFIASEHGIIVTVRDNGTGIHQEKEKTTHKSMAMDITNKRLNYLNKSITNDNLSIYTPESGEGTEVKIFIATD
jgi:sensor histidine kinase YesM